MLLKQRSSSSIAVQEPADPLVTCAICGETAPLTHYLSLYIGVGVSGSRGVKSLGCGNEDPDNHWACSLPCWHTLAHACIDEHVFPSLLQAHSACPESIHCDHATKLLKGAE